MIPAQLNNAGLALIKVLSKDKKYESLDLLQVNVTTLHSLHTLHWLSSTQRKEFYVNHFIV